MRLRNFFNKLLGRYEASEKTKKIKEEPAERNMIMTSNGKAIRYKKNGRIANQRGAFGRCKI